MAPSEVARTSATRRERTALARRPYRSWDVTTVSFREFLWLAMPCAREDSRQPNRADRAHCLGFATLVSSSHLSRLPASALRIEWWSVGEVRPMARWPLRMGAR